MSVVATNSDHIQRCLADNSNKIKLCIDVPGTAKTTSAVNFCLKNNKNNSIFFNSHRLTSEFSTDVLSSPVFKFKKTPLVNVYLGKYKKLTDLEQIEYKIKNRYPCNMCIMKDMFKCLKFGFAPRDYCRNYCGYRMMCDYKRIMDDNFASAQSAQSIPDLNIANMLTKSHINTEINDKLFKMFNGMYTVLDENFFNLLYNQMEFSAYYFRRYKDFILNVVNYDTSLNSLWIDYSALINKISDFLVGFKTMSAKKKKEFIRKDVVSFLSSYDTKDLDKWNTLVSLTVINNISKFNIQSINITSNLLEMFKKIQSSNDMEQAFDDGASLNLDDKLFSFVIDKKDTILNLIKNSSKFIVTSSVLNKEIFEALFPSLKNDYEIIKNKALQPSFKEVWRLTKGQYPKYTMWRKNQPTNQFSSLVGITADIIKQHMDKKILIVGFKDYVNNKFNGINYIEQALSKLIPGYKTIDMSYDYWYNLEGVNSYNDIDIEIQFGSPGVPGQYIKSMSSILNIKTDIINMIMVDGEQIQAAERLRSILNPNTKIIYQLCKNINNYYPKYTAFNSILGAKYSTLIDFIRKCGVCSTDEICNNFYKNRYPSNTIEKLLNKLNKNGLLFQSKIGTKNSTQNLWKAR